MTDLIQQNFQNEYKILLQCIQKDGQLQQELRTAATTSKKAEVHGKLASNANKCVNALSDDQRICLEQHNWSFERRSMTMQQLNTFLNMWRDNEERYSNAQGAADMQTQTEQFKLTMQFMGGQSTFSNPNTSRPQIMNGDLNTTSMLDYVPQQYQSSPPQYRVQDQPLDHRHVSKEDQAYQSSSQRRASQPHHSQQDQQDPQPQGQGHSQHHNQHQQYQYR